MQIIDWIILVLVGLSIATGVMRGLVKEVVALTIWFLAAFVAYKFAYLLQPWVEKYFHDPLTVTLISMLGIFILVMILGTIATAIFSLILRQTGLSGIDRLLGGCFGFVRGVFIICIILTGMRALAIPIDNYTHTSVFYPRLLPVINKMTQMIPNMLNKVQSIQGAVLKKITYEL
jgi:membrane protein required for colicin V production